jgi:hypothetical protein
VLENLIEATYTRDRKPHLFRANLGIEKPRFIFDSPWNTPRSGRASTW